jgi:glucose-6-phosphate isomerase
MKELEHQFSKAYASLLDKQQLLSSPSDLLTINSVAQKIKERYQKLIVIGFGASVLNLQCLMAATQQSSLEVLYIDNLDDRLLQSADFSRAAVFIISQSGQTDEIITLMQHLPLVAANVYVYTRLGSKVHLLATKMQANCFEYPATFKVGRYSLFCPVFLTLAQIMGCNSQLFLSGAKEALASQQMKQEVIAYTAHMLNNYQRGRKTLILLCYASQLEGLMHWIAQLVAESLGKNGFGFMPIVFSGTKYEHSMLQLFLDGPDDKFYQYFAHATQHQETKQDQPYLNTTLDKHCRATFNSLQTAQRPVECYNFSSINEQEIARLIVKYILAITLIGYNQGFETLNQPAVEQLKSDMI